MISFPRFLLPSRPQGARLRCHSLRHLRFYSPATFSPNRLSSWFVPKNPDRSTRRSDSARRHAVQKPSARTILDLNFRASRLPFPIFDLFAETRSSACSSRTAPVETLAKTHHHLSRRPRCRSHFSSASLHSKTSTPLSFPSPLPSLRSRRPRPTPPPPSPRSSSSSFRRRRRRRRRRCSSFSLSLSQRGVFVERRTPFVCRLAV